jgi:ACT domain-containing protein
LGLNDEDFKQKVSNAAKSAGIENSQLNDALKDTKHIKQMIGNMSEEDIKKALRSIKDEKLAQMIQTLQNQK